MSADVQDSAIFLQLPAVAWFLIFKLLSTAERFKCARVCRTWRQRIQQPILWKQEEPLKQSLHFLNSTMKGKHLVRLLLGDRYTSDKWSDMEGVTVSEAMEVQKFAFIAHRQKDRNRTRWDPTLDETRQLRNNANALKTNFDQALEIYDSAIELEPECGALHFDRGHLCEEANRLNFAVESYQRAVTLFPYDVSVRTRLGLTFHKLGDWDKALVTYLKTAALSPTYQLAFNNAGSIYFNIGQFDEALKCFDKCISLDFSAAVAFNNRGLCHFLTGDGKRAITDFSKSFALNSFDVTARANRAAAHILVGNWNQAIVDCEAEMARTRNEDEPGLAFFHKHLGNAHLGMDNAEKACQHFEKAVQLKPKYRKAQEGLRTARLQLGQDVEELDVLIPTLEIKVGELSTIFKYYLH